MRPSFLKTGLILLILLIFSGFVQAQLTIRYIGNMGVLISGEKSSVIIDGFHKEYDKDTYLFPPQSLVDSLTNAFDSEIPPIVVLAATHYHRDHLDGEQIAAFMEANPNALFFGSNQSVDLVKKSNADLDDQIIEVDTDSYIKQSVKHSGVTITSFYLNHVNPNRHGAVQNVGYLVEIEGQKIIHVGDSNWFEEAFSLLDLEKEKIDIAILPFWMLIDENSQTKLQKWINPTHYIATHITPVRYERYESAVKEFSPGSLLLIHLNTVLEFDD